MKQANRVRIASIGYAHFIQKLGYQAQEYKKRSLHITYLVQNIDSDSLKIASEYGAVITPVPSAPALRLLFTIYFILKEKIQTIEVYDTGLLTFLYVSIAKLLGKRVIIFLIGSELNKTDWNVKSQSLKRFIKRLGLYLSLKVADRIIYKELHMKTQLEIWRLKHKSHFVHNAIPIVASNNLSSHQKDIDVLFLNSIRKVRNPHLFVNSIEILNNILPNLKVVMAGFHTLGNGFHESPEPNSETEILNLISKKNISNIRTLPFVNSSYELMKRSKVFVLPADIIFANYSLLESMAAGCVPVVTNGNGAELIIDNNINGLITGFNEKDIAKAIHDVLINHRMLQRMSKNATEKISKTFSIDSWGEKIFTIYQNL